MTSRSRDQEWHQPPDPHGCSEEQYGRCIWGCPRAGCFEYPSLGPGFMCWSCGKFLYTFAAEGAGEDIERPKGSA
jgi:hypothetical protein